MIGFGFSHKTYLIGWFGFVWAVYSSLALLNYWHFGPGIDLGMFSQAVFHYSHFETPTTSVSNGPSLLGDHFHPILMVLAPFYWFFPNAQVLILAQAFLASVAVFPVYFFVQKRLGNIAGLLFAISYSLYWGIQLLVMNDFHEVAVAVPLIAFAIYFMDQNKMKSLLICLFLLLCTKEDQCFFAAFVGIYLGLIEKRVKLGGAIVVAAIGALFLITKVLMPYFGGTPFGHFTYYSRFGATPFEALLTVFQKPYLLLTVPFDQITKLKTGFYTFCPFLFFSFFSPMILLAFPLIGERFLSDVWFLSVMGFHYSATIAPVVAMTAADGIFNAFKFIRNDELKKKICICSGAAALALNLWFIPKFPLWNLSRISFWEISDSDKTGYKALALIPPEASVMAQDCIMPHLCNREAPVHVLGNSAAEHDYVIAAKNLNPWPNDSSAQIEAYLRDKLENGYEKIFDENGWVVLKKSGN